MDDQLLKLLKTNYTILTRPSETNDASGGIYCGSGWYDLVDCALDRIENHFKYTVMVEGKSEIEVPRVLQIKEKFGGLRIYLSCDNHFTTGVCGIAEAMSVRTCENCGCPGNIDYELPWIKTVCKECVGEDTKKRNKAHINRLIRRDGDRRNEVFG